MAAAPNDAPDDAADDAARAAPRLPAAAPASGAHAWNALSWLTATMVLAVLVPTLLFTAAALALRAQELEQARSQIDGAVAIAAEHASKVFEVNAALLGRLADALGNDSDEALRAREESLHRQMQHMAEGLPQLQGLFVLGADGRLVATNVAFPAPRNIDFTDRPFYRHHRIGGVQPFVSDVLTSRTTGETFFDLSVRREGPGGRFAGALSSSLKPQYFAALYSALPGAGAGLNVALVRSDGAVLAGWPHMPQARDLPGNGASAPVAPEALPPYSASAAGAASASRAADTPEEMSRLFASRPLPGVPVRVVAWMERDAALASWRRSLALLAALAFPTAIALVGVAFVARRRTLRSLAMARELHARSARERQIEETLRQAQKLEAMGRLTGGVAHDFNNLLMIVSNNLYLMRRMQPQPATDGAPIAAIERAVTAGTRLTRQLLSFSRSQPLRPEVVDLGQRMPEIVELLAPALGSSITVTTQVEPGAAPIRADAAELELAMVNLALNARDAMPEGGRLHVQVRNAAAGTVAGIDGPAVVIAVTDNGSGIAPHDIGRVFEPFFTTKALGRGTGLGLAQVYGFCRRAGGTATIASGAGTGAGSGGGRGTTVRMAFPAARAGAADADGAAAAGAGGTAAALPSLEGVRALLVEDNDDVATATGDVLASMGCVVRRVDGADAAMARLAAIGDDYDVVITDMVMPGSMDGIELAQRLRQRHPQLPVLLMSGYTDSLERATALGLHVLPKPCDPPVIAAAVAAAIAQRRPSASVRQGKP
ncbi:MAG: response regulator [Rubrivivax sp.]|nr:response regulator [Rubrivivax sp.]